jgi:hypothetical protein
VKFSKTAKGLTGISTPLVGMSWQADDLEVSAARRVFAFLEDRRVLYARDSVGDPRALRPFRSRNPPTSAVCFFGSGSITALRQSSCQTRCCWLVIA